jgi:folate-binding protein YgfZ
VGATTLEHDVRALREGRGYAELAETELTLVSGSDARSWLHDLVTTDVESLAPRRTRPSLLLTPTGRIRASFHVLAIGDDEVLLAQAPGPEPIGDLLAPYVLSSDVAIRPAAMRVLAAPGGAHTRDPVEGAFRPSVLGDGFDLVCGAGETELEEARERLARAELRPCSAEAVERLRIERGEPTFPVDLDTESLPGEAGWDVPPVTDRAKGCFLGQESVAKVANLGHPTRVVLAVSADRPLVAGDAVLADGRPAGVVTSGIRELGLVRVRWEARDATLTTSSGARMRRR